MNAYKLYTSANAVGSTNISANPNRNESTPETPCPTHISQPKFISVDFATDKDNSLSPIPYAQETRCVRVHQRLQQLRAEESLPGGHHAPQNRSQLLPQLRGFARSQSWDKLKDSHRVFMLRSVVDVHACRALTQHNHEEKGMSYETGEDMS